MGSSKNSENQANTGGLLRQGKPTECSRTGDTAGPETSNKGTRMETAETRINRSSGGKRRARKKKSGKTTQKFLNRLPRNSKPNICPLISYHIILMGKAVSSQWLIGSVTKSGAK
jgi:hypothetical protein